MGITKVTAISTLRIPLGPWIIVLPTARDWAWTGTRWVRHRHGISREAQVCNFATEKEALEYAHQHLLEQQKAETPTGSAGTPPQASTGRETAFRAPTQTTTRKGKPK